MNKNRIKELHKKTQESILSGKYELAKKYYEEQLIEISDTINSYNPKFESYAEFLWEYFDSLTFSENLKKEINRILNTQSIKMIDRYSLYMLAGHLEKKHHNIKNAIYWYELANEINKAGFVESKKSEIILEELKKERL